jgi:hypothetical protein
LSAVFAGWFQINCYTSGGVGLRGISTPPRGATATRCSSCSLRRSASQEAGKKQSRVAYAADHLNEDIAFLESARVTQVLLGSMPMGDSAMVGSESLIATTSSNGIPFTRRSREMLTLKRHVENRKIVSIRWQSASANAL